MDDQAIGLAIRELRIRRGWRQQDLAVRAAVSRGTVSRVERGQLDCVTLGALHRTCRALDARADLRLRWQGAELDRLLNRRHSAMHDEMARLLSAASGWLFAPEVSFSIYGERGLIDILAFHAPSGIVVVIELKTDIVDVQELIGSVDRKRRLAARIAADRGWTASRATAWVVVADSRANRERVVRHANVLRAAFPLDGRQARGWLAAPVAGSGLLSFMHTARHNGAMSAFAVRKRVRHRSVAPRAAGPRTAPASERPAAPLQPPPTDR